MVRLSKSQLINFLNCQWKWYLDYLKPYKVRNGKIIVNNLEFSRGYEIEDTEDGRGLRHISQEPAEGTPLKIGLELHEIFEKFYSIPESKNVGKPYEKNIYDILMTMENAWKYKEHISNFANFNAQIILDKGADNYHPVSVEQNIFNESLNFTGIIDRVDYSEDEGYSIIDYKTGKMSRVDKYLLELSLYAIIYEKETGNQVNKAGIYFSKRNRLRMLDITQRNKREALAVLGEVRKKIKTCIKNGNDFEKKYTYLCKFCNWSDICAKVEK